ncbi:MAG: hypothetical protein ACJAUK_002467 [Colwellia polaris]|jgi:hypothetical protein
MKKLSHTKYPVSDKQKNTTQVLLFPTNTILFNGEIVVEHVTESVKFRAILKTIQLAMRTNWFANKIKEGTKLSYINSISAFYSWLELHKIKPSYNIIKNFEVFEINRGLKPQCTLAKKVLTVLRKGRLEDGLSKDEGRFVRELCLKTRLARCEPSESIDLPGWFSRHQWIRSEMQENYHRLASPKRVMKSFTVTVATTLITLLQTRKSLIENKDLWGSYLSSTILHTSSRATQNLVAQLLQSLHLSNDFRKAQTELVVKLECIKPKDMKKATQLVSRHGADGYSKMLKGINSNYPYRRPSIFSTSTLSIIEQQLMYYLLCSLTVQPTDANKITRNNFVIKRNKNGKARYIRIGYRKGRGDANQEPPLLRAGDIVFEAIDLYLASMPPQQHKLFIDKMVRPFVLNNPNYSERKVINCSSIFILYRMWSSDEFTQTLNKQFKTHKTDDLFLKAFKCFMGKDVITHNLWRKTPDGYGLYEDYLAQVEKSAPQTLFTGTHIKNTAVYSRVDQYRDDDLINENSHTSLTEKLSYMTDNNQEWLNQVGRITRMVLKDMESHAFAPSITGIEAEVIDLKVQTKVSKSRDDSKVKVNKIGQVVQKKDASEDQIVVIDSIDTAMLMLHYIDQAELKYKELVRINPQFLASTVLVNVEWMHSCLEQFEPDNILAANKKYKKIKAVLPGLFEHELARGITI